MINDFHLSDPEQMPFLAHVFALAQAHEKQKKRAEGKNIELLQKINALVEDTKPLLPSSPQELLFEALSGRNRKLLDDITFVDSKTKKNVKTLHAPTWILDDFPQSEYEREEGQDLKYFQITPFFGADKKKDDDNKLLDYFEKILTEHKVPPDSIRVYQDHLRGRLEQLRRERDVTRSRVDEPTTLENAISNLMEELGTQRCVDDGGCDHGQCRYGFCTRP
jgi:hypothetical protein